jgi:hypothetical protein
MEMAFFHHGLFQVPIINMTQSVCGEVRHKITKSASQLGQGNLAVVIINYVGTCFGSHSRLIPGLCLLQDCLGGNAKTIMVANISPASDSLQETLSTLRFAQGVKSIENKVRSVCVITCMFSITVRTRVKQEIVKRWLTCMQDMCRSLPLGCLLFSIQWGWVLP